MLSKCFIHPATAPDLTKRRPWITGKYPRGQSVLPQLAFKNIMKITLAKRGTNKRVVDTSNINIPDLWKIAQRTTSGGGEYPKN
jgi:hypothetical protein